MSDVGRNDPCPCGSGMKFKRCHGAAQPTLAPTPRRLAPPLVAPLLEQAAALERDGRTEDAARVYRTVLESYPQDASALEGLGVIALNENRADAALPLLGLAARL